MALPFVRASSTFLFSPGEELKLAGARSSHSNLIPNGSLVRSATWIDRSKIRDAEDSKV